MTAVVVAVVRLLAIGWVLTTLTVGALILGAFWRDAYENRHARAARRRSDVAVARANGAQWGAR